jgi:hypothetical protein
MDILEFYGYDPDHPKKVVISPPKTIADVEALGQSLQKQQAGVEDERIPIISLISKFPYLQVVPMLMIPYRYGRVG